MPRTRLGKVSGELWEQVFPLIPVAPLPAKGDRHQMANRAAFTAIVYVLSTGIQWNALPRELGASSTFHDRFQQWERAGVFQALWQAGLLTTMNWLASNAIFFTFRPKWRSVSPEWLLSASLPRGAAVQEGNASRKRRGSGSVSKKSK